MKNVVAVPQAGDGSTPVGTNEPTSHLQTRPLKWSGTARYTSEFSELELLGKGGFGEVYKVKNNLDGCVYAVKKILLQDKRENKKILREVSALSRLSHKHIVRYYQSWIESGEARKDEEDLFPTLSSSPSKGGSFLKAGTPRASSPIRASPPNDRGSPGRQISSSPIKTPTFTKQSPSPTKSISPTGMIYPSHSPSPSSSPSPSKSILIGGNRDDKIFKEGLQIMPSNSLQLEMEKEIQRSIKYSGSWEIRGSFGGRSRSSAGKPQVVSVNDMVAFKSWQSMHFLGMPSDDNESDASVECSESNSESEGPNATDDTELSLFGDFEFNDDELQPRVTNQQALEAASESDSDFEGEAERSSASSDDDIGLFFSDVNKDLTGSDLWTSKGSEDPTLAPPPAAKLKRKVTFSENEIVPYNKNGGDTSEDEEDGMGFVKIVCNICAKSYDDWEVSFKEWHLIDVALQPLNLCPDCYRGQLKLIGVSIEGIQIKKKPAVPQYLYIQMEYCSVTLKDELESKQLWVKYPPGKIWQLFMQIVSAIAYLHSHDCIHRDLKPGNIFISDGVIKLGDFGLVTGPIVLRRAESVKHLLTVSALRSPRIHNRGKDNTSDVGTYLYSSPENKTNSYSTKVDMYSLGIILFELWHPFDTLMERCVLIENLRNKCTLPKVFMEKYPEQSEYILQLVNHDPSKRPAAEELLQRLSAKHKYNSSSSRRLTQHASLQQKVEELSAENAHLKGELVSMKEAMAAMQAQMEHLQKQLAATGGGGISK